ncbi:putative ubiquitin carboxyl-terminal hydrolase 19 [Phaeomoniella chlamydospora]|uniref:Putative ubiquitin carboxyl-terminal hydrolase 19 n=1 Tax=Phaeomoniella chlamydospora TaxID=158046 RepID=A0A0G2GDL1_PHACM|nr:putative ubiquitin carboxyl-terminal hydrolase 19 [Phaeomoniella chlamydospora]
MDAHFQFATKDEFWRLQEDLKDIYATQAQQAERLSRLERRRDEDNRMKSLWGPQSPFPTGVASTPQQEYNPAAEAFKNFESESHISSAVVRQLELEHNLLEESGLQKIKLSVYLTEATIQHSSSRSGSPVPQVPSLTAKFTVYEASHDDPSIQVILGSDVLRSHNGDILFSEDRLLVFDDERNRLAVPLVRPESESVYQSLSTVGGFLQESQNARAITKPVSHGNTNGNLPPGFNQAPPKFDLQGSSTDSSAPTSPAILPTNESARDTERGKLDVDASADLGDQRDRSDDNQSSNGEKPSSGPKPSNVWGSSSWRSGSSAPTMADAAKSTASGYSRAVSGRGMKVLRPSTGKSMANYTRTVSGTAGDSKPFFEQPPRQASFADTAKSQATAAKSTSDPNAAPTKANPIGQASAFGWLNSSAAGGRDRSIRSGQTGPDPKA